MGKRFDELQSLIEDEFFKINEQYDLNLTERICGIFASEAARIAGAFYFSDYVDLENENTKLKKELEKKGKDDS